MMKMKYMEKYSKSVKKGQFTLRNDYTQKIPFKKKLRNFIKRTYMNIKIRYHNYSYKHMVNFFTFIIVILFLTYFVNNLNLSITVWAFKYLPIIRIVEPFSLIYVVLKVFLQLVIFSLYEYFGLYNYFLIHTIDNMFMSFILYYIDWVDYQYKHLKLNKRVY